LCTRVGRRKGEFNHIRQVAPVHLYVRAQWNYLANTIEPPICGGDAVLCQIILTTCLHHVRVDVPIALQDVDEADKASELVSDERIPLHIVVFKKDAELLSQHITGFGAVTEVPHRSGILGSLTTLLMSYYVFDLKIPPRHAMVLSVFQAIVMEEPPSGTLSQNCIFFMKKLRLAIEQLPASAAHPE